MFSLLPQPKWFPFYISAADLENVDYIAIAVSLALTAFIVSVLGCFLWRARNRSAMGTDNEMGQVSIESPCQLK